MALNYYRKIHKIKIKNRKKHNLYSKHTIYSTFQTSFNAQICRTC